ncbi:Heavy metal translocating P-type ATPase [Candidatus Sulfopaludibacter sp. SbA3]|nr:Heavy metal translocating P-type ATPase [Candidatus Sulfopaludibacter sp. SbA3]
MTCSLCGLDSGASAFCCAGCENVYAILLESGVLASGQNFRESEVYLQSLKLGLISNRANPLPAIPADAKTREAVYRLSGLWCTSCGWLIEHALTRIRGVASAEVMFASDLLRVRYCPQYLPADRIAAGVEALGYRAAEYPGNNVAADSERKDLLLRLGIAAFLSMNVMMFSLVVYTSYFQKIGTSFAHYIPFLLMVLATPSVFYCAAPILRIAANGLRLGVLRMESLLAMGILMAYGYSVVLTFSGNDHVYFDTACAIVTLVLTGKTIERAAKEKTARAIALLYGLMPNKARIMVDGRERFVSIDALHAGGLFRVKSGERIPADGIVREGRSHADESVLTGESAPRAKGPGDAVVGGSINVGGVLEIEATRVGSESTLARIVQTVERAAASRTDVEHSVDRVARLFIPVVLAVAVLTCLGWQYRTGSIAEALMHAIAVLVIACPCALGIATPLALTAAVAAASHRGILVRDTRVLEAIRKVDVVVLDKTGTATLGEFRVLECTGDTSRMQELAAIEAFSEHPIAKAVVEHAKTTPSRSWLGSEPGPEGTPSASGPSVKDVCLHAGMGISGVIGGTRYFIGNSKLAAAFDAAAESGPGVWFGWDGAVRGSITFGDRVRPDAAALCASLRRRGIRTLLLSGDSRAATEAIAAEIGADEWHAEATPEEKLETLRALQQSGAVVAMVGDGVNDAPSLAQSDLGIALGSGADIAMQAAPLVLMGTSLAGVIETLDVAQRAFRIVRQNLFWAFAYNAAGITLAITGVLNPILAAAAMVLSSLSVIGNSRRLS